MRGFKVFAAFNRASKGVADMFQNSLSKRVVKLREQLAYKSAEAVRDSVVAKIPNKPEFKEYRESLKVAQITGLPSKTTGYSVIGKPKKRKAQNLDPETTLVYVRTKRRLAGTSPLVQTLVEFSPWTLNTLPSVSLKGEATLAYRKVSSREVAQVARRRKADRRKWEKALRAKNAIRNKSKQKATAIKGPMRQDLPFTALRLEYGQAGSNAKPHWRPAVSNLKRIAIPNMRNSSDLNRTIADPDFKAWTQLPKMKTSLRIPVKVAKELGSFQKKLKVKW